MALVKYGGGIIQMSGSIAGTTHARNRYGNYVRARTKPVNPQTDLQTAVRESLAFLVQRWSATLTANQRTAWDLYGSNVAMQNKLGETIHLSGFNHYLRSNVSFKAIIYPVIDDGPVVFELPAQDPTFAVTSSEGTQDITCAFDDTMDWATEAAADLIIYQGTPQNAQRNFFDGPWRFLTITTGVDPGGPVEPKVQAAVFAIAEGQRVWCYARIRRADGRISTPFRADHIVAA